MKIKNAVTKKERKFISKRLLEKEWIFINDWSWIRKILQDVQKRVNGNIKQK